MHVICISKTQFGSSRAARCTSRSPASNAGVSFTDVRPDSVLHVSGSGRFSRYPVGKQRTAHVLRRVPSPYFGTGGLHLGETIRLQRCISSGFAGKQRIPWCGEYVHHFPPLSSAGVLRSIWI